MSSASYKESLKFQSIRAMGETLRANRKDLIDLCLPPGLNAFLENNFVQLVVPHLGIKKLKIVSKTSIKKKTKIKISYMDDSSELESDEEISPFRINKRCRMRAKAAEAKRRAVLQQEAATTRKSVAPNESDSHSSSEDDVVQLFSGGKKEKKSNQVPEEKPTARISRRGFSLFIDSEDSDN